MRATILQHRSSPVQFDPPPSDPREQPVQDGYALPQPGVSDPIRATIDCSEPEQMCVCGVPTRLHHSLDLRTWVGCEGARRNRMPENPTRYADPYPAVTCEVRKAMLIACGPDLEIHCAHYSHDELLAIAHTLAKAAVSAYLREMAK